MKDQIMYAKAEKMFNNFKNFYFTEHERAKQNQNFVDIDDVTEWIASSIFKEDERFMKNGTMTPELRSLESVEEEKQIAAAVDEGMNNLAIEIVENIFIPFGCFKEIEINDEEYKWAIE